MTKLLALLTVALLAGCATQPTGKAYPGKPLYLPNGESFTAQEFAFDVPRTFDSGSCVAAGGTLLYRLPQQTWYCKERVGMNGYHIVALEDW